MPFFIMGGGNNTISGSVHGVASGHNDTIQIFLGLPMTGPMQQDVAITGTGDAAADGSYTFSNLPDGEYFLFTDPSITIGAGSYFGSPMPESIWVNGGATETKILL